MNAALQTLEEKLEGEFFGLTPFPVRCRAVALLQNKVCNNATFNDQDALVTNLSNCSLAAMVSTFLWVQTKKIKLRHTERGISTYAPAWAFNAPDANLTAYRQRDPCPLLITLSNGLLYCYISHYNGHSPQPGNCLLSQMHQGWKMTTFAYRMPAQISRRMTLSDFESEWYKLHLAMEIARRKAATNTTVDPFYTLPVAVGVVMATQLIRKDYGNQNTNLDVLHNFAYSRGAYHIFGADRVDKFGRLTQR
jgi:hypothetical protein